MWSIYLTMQHRQRPSWIISVVISQNGSERTNRDSRRTVASWNVFELGRWLRTSLSLYIDIYALYIDIYGTLNDIKRLSLSTSTWYIKWFTYTGATRFESRNLPSKDGWRNIPEDSRNNWVSCRTDGSFWIRRTCCTTQMRSRRRWKAFCTWIDVNVL